MPTISALFHSLYFAAVIGSVLFHPLLGIFGYILTYHINPASHWWAISFIRYSYLCYIVTVVSFLIHYQKLKFQKTIEPQEALLVLYVIIIWVSMPLGLPGGTDAGLSLSIKMTKVLVIILIASRIVTTLKFYKFMIWLFILTGFFLSYELYTAPHWKFFQGRFECCVGGTDFGEGNFLAVHLASLFPFMGVIFIRSKWMVRAMLMLVIAFTVNGIVLIRSRGSFLAITAGALIINLFPGPLKRSLVLLMSLLGICGFLYITDANFWNRMDTIQTDEEAMDSSAQGRIKAWRAALKMVMDQPLGVGVGNFSTYVGVYDPEIPGKDTHNTYFRCLGELGIHGFLILIAIVLVAFKNVSELERDIRVKEGPPDLRYYLAALRTSLVIYIVGSMTLTHTYIEDYFWLLMQPVFLKRVFQNSHQEGIV